jgi:beta-N-acetylhexosaminidase
MGLDLFPFIFGCEGEKITSQECVFFRKAQPFGFILFGRNLKNPKQIYGLCRSLRDAVGWNAPVMIDQEGGRVARLGAPHWFEFPPALEHSKIFHAERTFWLRGRLIAENLRLSGIDVNCAPVGDIAQPETHHILRNRCYGTNKSEVIINARALNSGLRHGGISGVLKHIPGHGRAKLDSHLVLPKVLLDQAVLEDTDFSVFKEFKDMDMGMTAHLIFDQLDPNNPATQSATIINMIRNKIGFKGLLITDDISMKALAGNLNTRALKALDAGCDIVLHCNGDLQEMKLLHQNCRELAGASLDRAKLAINNRPTPVSIDILRLKEEFESLLNE